MNGLSIKPSAKTGAIQVKSTGSSRPCCVFSSISMWGRFSASSISTARRPFVSPLNCRRTTADVSSSAFSERNWK